MREYYKPYELGAPLPMKLQHTTLGTGIWTENGLGDLIMVHSPTNETALTD